MSLCTKIWEEPKIFKRIIAEKLWRYVNFGRFSMKTTQTVSHNQSSPKGLNYCELYGWKMPNTPCKGKSFIHNESVTLLPLRWYSYRYNPGRCPTLYTHLWQFSTSHICRRNCQVLFWKLYILDVIGCCSLTMLRVLQQSMLSMAVSLLWKDSSASMFCHSPW